MAFLIGGILVLASVANFGILARQRTLIMPAVLALLCIPPLAQIDGPDGRATRKRPGSWRRPRDTPENPARGRASRPLPP